MQSSKPKSSATDASSNKPAPAAAKAGNGKPGRAGSTKPDAGAPPFQKSRSSRTESKPAIERKPSPRLSNTVPDHKPLRAPKGPDLKAQFGEVKEDLNKVKEQLALVEQEKGRVEEELREAKKLAEEANEKLKEALAAQKSAEESSEREKVRADEVELAGIVASKRREAELGEELESIRKKQSLDAEALLSVTRELERVKGELEASSKAKISALGQAEDLKKVAETNAARVEVLNGEIDRLKSLLDSRLDNTGGDAAELIMKLDSEIDSLRYELEIAKQAEEKLVIVESLVERLSNDADNAKIAELDSLKLVDEWKSKAELLETQLMEARRSEKSSLESLASLQKQLEESKASAQDFEFETAALRQKIKLLKDRLEEANEAEKSSSESQASLAKQLQEVSASLQDAESEAAVLRGKVESLEIEVADVKKSELKSSKLADEWKQKAEYLEAQLEEANQSCESLASATIQLEESSSSLQEVLSENAALRMKIESLEIELAQCKKELMDSENRLDGARQEAIEMGKAVQELKSGIQTLEQEKLEVLNSEKVDESFSEERNKLLKGLEMAKEEEEKAKKAMEGLASALHEISSEARETQEILLTKRIEHEDAHAQIEQLRLALRNTKENYEVMLDEARYEIVCLKKALEKFESEGEKAQANGYAERPDFFRIRESDNGITSFEAKMMNESESVKENGNVMAAEVREAEPRLNGANGETEAAKAEISEGNELQSILQEDELSTLLADGTETRLEENGELSNSEKEYDLIPNSQEIPVESVNGSKEEIPKSGDLKERKENGNGNGNHYLGEEEPVEVEDKMWEGYRGAEKVDNLSSELDNEEEAVNGHLEPKLGNGGCESFEHKSGLPSDIAEDGAVSPTKQQEQQQLKKKKNLFRFGGLLKKKSPHKP